MKTINHNIDEFNNTDKFNNIDKTSIKNLKKKSKYLRKMKQKNGNLNLFEKSGEVKEIKFTSGAIIKFIDTGDGELTCFSKEYDIEDYLWL